MITAGLRTAMRAVTLALSLVLSTFTAAAADGPVLIGPYETKGTVVVADCGSFRVIDDYVMNHTVQLFLDENGDPLSLIEHLTGTDTLYNSVTGESYTMSFANNNIIDFTASPPQGATSGNAVRLVIPRYGAVFLEVGRIVVDGDGNVYFQAGQHQFWDADYASLCAAMA